MVEYGREKQVIVRVKRQQSPKGRTLGRVCAAVAPAMNVIICLRDIAERPVTRDGKKTTPITYDSNCLEEVCGSCAMLINGGAHGMFRAGGPARSANRIEPMSKFPVVRDLAVDRQFMFESLKRVKAWIPIDGTYDLGEGPRMAPEAAGKSLSAFALHHVRKLSGGLPAGERQQQIHGRRDHQPGAAFQHASDRRDACEGALQASMGTAASKIAPTRKIA